jgi:hypothetical protein
VRDHAIVCSQFWTGETGRFLRECGADAQRVALYLLTAPSSTMIGLYYLPLPTLEHEVGIKREGALKALRSLQEAGFAAYDGATETVFVREMARFQIGDVLDPKDNRVKSVERQAGMMCKSPFYRDFLMRYREAFHLRNVPDPGAGREAPSKPLRSQGQGQDQGQDQGEDKPAAQASTATAGAATVASLLTFPCCAGKRSKEQTWDLPQDYVSELSESFAGVDVLTECRKALAWVRANPAKRKTAGGMREFLFRWMSREQNSGRSRGGNGARHTAGGSKLDEKLAMIDGIFSDEVKR